MSKLLVVLLVLTLAGPALCGPDVIANLRQAGEAMMKEHGTDIDELEGASDNSDEITKLPGLDSAVNFKHYAGYLDTHDNTKHHFYWLTESQNKPAEDPIVLWLNGGPGCSSLDGLLSEMGPYLATDSGQKLELNPHAWNKVANVFHMESPAGVGFSYANNGNVTIGDDEVAEDNYNALLSFFAKYPQFKTNKFFIFGESYGGVYVPTLVKKVIEGSLRGEFPAKLEGWAVGNGLESYATNDDSLMYYAYFHGLIGTELMEDMLSTCCNDTTSKKCKFSAGTSSECKAAVAKGMHVVYSAGLNFYSLYMDCFPGRSATVKRSLENLWMSVPKPDLALQGLPGGDVPCIDSVSMSNYLNRPDVRAALKIRSEFAPKEWSICSDEVGEKYSRDVKSTKEYLEFNIKHARALYYYGDTDMACNFLGMEWFLDDLNLPKNGERTPWKVGGQIAGFNQKYGDNLQFLVVKGAGHMVPQWVPKWSMDFLVKFLAGKDIA